MKKINIDYIDRVHVDYKEILINRGYLLQWGLFLLLENKNGAEKYLDIFFNPKNLTIIENSFRSLLKYGIVLSIITKSRKCFSLIKDHFYGNSYFSLLSAPHDQDSQQESNDGCFYELFDSLYINFDLEKSIQNLEECKKVDKFLKK